MLAVYFNGTFFEGLFLQFLHCKNKGLYLEFEQGFVTQSQLRTQAYFVVKCNIHLLYLNICPAVEVASSSVDTLAAVTNARCVIDPLNEAASLCQGRHRKPEDSTL